ncbi:MAG: hypothetical protein ACYDHU_12495 [Acidimicrobiales bacterium]
MTARLTSEHRLAGAVTKVDVPAVGGGWLVCRVLRIAEVPH